MDKDKVQTAGPKQYHTHRSVQATWLPQKGLRVLSPLLLNTTYENSILSCY